MNWHVVFHPREKKHWWAKRFSHVSLAGFENNTWVHLDLGRATVDVQAFYAQQEVEDYLSYLTAYHTVVQFGQAKGDGFGFWRPMTCVSFVKHTLGIKSCALRPDGLFEILTVGNNSVKIYDAQSSSGNI